MTERQDHSTEAATLDSLRRRGDLNEAEIAQLEKLELAEQTRIRQQQRGIAGCAAFPLTALAMIGAASLLRMVHDHSPWVPWSKFPDDGPPEIVIMLVAVAVPLVLAGAVWQVLHND